MSAIAKYDRLLGAVVLAAIGCGQGTPPEDAGGAREPGPLLASASAQLTQVRPRRTVMLGEIEPTQLDAQTSWWPVTATASFRTTAAGVDLSLMVSDCRTSYSYPVLIHEGADCSELQRGSPTWDGARGSLSAKAFCFGSIARLYLSRSNQAEKPWTLGGPNDSNLIGRTIAMHDPESMEPLACATIAADSTAPATALDPARRPSTNALNEIAGACLLLQLNAELSVDSRACPDPDEVADCALTHCVAPCLDSCVDYLGCVSGASAACSSECPLDQACTSCLGPVTQCLLGFCGEKLSCAPSPEPGGPCTQLRECCMRQGPVEDSCMRYADQMEQLGGDPTCRGALDDWDFNANLAYRSPCYTDAGIPTD